MQEWRGWPLERLMYAFLAIAFAVISFQIYLDHGVVGHFQFWPQRIPVIYTPVVALAALLYAVSRSNAMRSFYLGAMGLAVVVGLMGTYYHIDGLMDMGGLSLHNIAHGPPFLLPLTYAALSAMGLATALWRLKVTAPDFRPKYDEVQATRRYRGRIPG